MRANNAGADTVFWGGLGIFAVFVLFCKVMGYTLFYAYRFTVWFCRKLRQFAVWSWPYIKRFLIWTWMLIRRTSVYLWNVLNHKYANWRDSREEKNFIPMTPHVTRVA